MNILPELQKLIPPLSVAEFKQLKKNCIDNGITDALTVAVFPNRNSEEVKALADGHNRFNIAEKHNLKFGTVEKSFNGINDVKVWMIKNQFGRRSLSLYQRGVLVLTLKPLVRAVAKENQKRKPKSVCQTSDKQNPIDTKKELANISGVSHDTLARIEKIETEATEDVKEKLRRNEISINKAYQELINPHFTNNSNKWGTPHFIISCVKDVLGVIDLDPCSNYGVPSIPANRYFTEIDDGLKKKWSGRVYVNPPYGSDIIDWVKKSVYEYEISNVCELILLTPSRTDTKWFRLLNKYIRCFINGRLKFSQNGINGYGGNVAPFPSMVVYMGENIDNFVDCFSKVGDIYISYERI